MMSAIEVERSRPVVLLGVETALRLFGDSNPIDKTIQIEGVHFRVVGVSQKKGGFLGNSLAIGMPCLTVDPADADWLIADAERDPAATTAVDIQALTVTRSGRTIQARLPKSVQEAFLSGDWDATGQLLAAGAEAEAVAARLPYVRGF